MEKDCRNCLCNIDNNYIYCCQYLFTEKPKDKEDCHIGVDVE